MSLTAPAMARKAIAAALGVTILHLTSENARPFLRIVVSRCSSPNRARPSVAAASWASSAWLTGRAADR